MEAIFLRGKGRKIGSSIFWKEKENRKTGRPIFGKEKVRQKDICLRGKERLWKELEKGIKSGESTFVLRR